MTTKNYDVPIGITQYIVPTSGILQRNYSYPFWNSFARTGANMPKYKLQIRNGESAVNSLTASKYERRIGNVKRLSMFIRSQHANNFGQIVELSDSFPFFNSFYLTNYPNPNGSSAGMPEANNRASAAIFKAIRAEMYQISGPTFLGELRQSLQMIRRPAAALQKGLGAYMLKVEKNLKSIKKLPPSTRSVRDKFGNWQPIGKIKSQEIDVKKMLADTWLEYSFGWSPLLKDIKAGAEALARFGTDIRRSRVSAIGVHENVILEISDKTGASSAGFTTRYSVRDIQLNRVTYKVGLSASMNVPSGTPDRLIELCGFSLQNVVPTVWELLPWSFLVDYFINVNAVLEAYTTDTAAVKWASKTSLTGVVRTVTGRVDVRDSQADFGSYFVASGDSDAGMFVLDVTSLTRTSGLTYPTLTFKLPDTPRQVGNMAALLVSQGRIRRDNSV